MFFLVELLYEGNGMLVGLYDSEIFVGYVMYGWYLVKYKSVWFDCFMID